MDRFPADAPRDRVIRALESLGFRLVRKREHIAMIRNESEACRHPEGVRDPRLHSNARGLRSPAITGLLPERGSGNTVRVGLRSPKARPARGAPSRATPACEKSALDTAPEGFYPELVPRK